MRNSLQDQLLKAGLVNEKQIKSANKKEKQPKQSKDQRNAPDAARLAAEQALADKAERDRLLAQQQREVQLQKEIAAQIRQIIEQSRQARGKGDVGYNFVDGKLIKKLFVTQPQADQLARGQLAIVKLGEQYELVPTVVAEKIRERDESCVLVLNTRQEIVDEDDPYADYKIPDDLMW